jgi:hypothetical protein
VRAVMVVVVRELTQHPSEMTFADHDDVIEVMSGRTGPAGTDGEPSEPPVC